LGNLNVNFYSTKDYENKSNWAIYENKANTKPIQTQSNPIPEKAKMNVTSIITKGYENKPRFRAKAKQTQYKPKQTQFQTKLRFDESVAGDQPADLDERNVKRLVDCYNIFIYYTWKCRIVLKRTVGRLTAKVGLGKINSIELKGGKNEKGKTNIREFGE
jgi:hypothetical protein